MNNAQRYRNTRYRKLLEPILPEYWAYITLDNGETISWETHGDLILLDTDFGDNGMGSFTPATNGIFLLPNYLPWPLEWAYQHSGSATTSDYVLLLYAGDNGQTKINIHFTINP